MRARGGCKKRVVKRERRLRIESRRAASQTLPGKNGRRKKELWGCTRVWHKDVLRDWQTSLRPERARMKSGVRPLRGRLDRCDRGYLWCCVRRDHRLFLRPFLGEETSILDGWSHGIGQAALLLGVVEQMLQASSEFRAESVWPCRVDEPHVEHVAKMDAVFIAEARQFHPHE